MPSTIKEIKLKNYKRFRDFKVIPNPRINILVGDNEVGKSSILEAIDLVTRVMCEELNRLGLINSLVLRQFMTSMPVSGHMPIFR